jgi:hypothetical protein
LNGLLNHDFDFQNFKRGTIGGNLINQSSMSSINEEVKRLIAGNEDHLKLLISYVQHFKDIAISVEEQNESTQTGAYEKDHQNVEKLEEIAKEFIKMREETE